MNERALFLQKIRFDANGLSELTFPSLPSNLPKDEVIVAKIPSRVHLFRSWPPTNSLTEEDISEVTENYLMIFHLPVSIYIDNEEVSNFLNSIFYDIKENFELLLIIEKINDTKTSQKDAKLSLHNSILGTFGSILSLLRTKKIITSSNVELWMENLIVTSRYLLKTLNLNCFYFSFSEDKKFAHNQCEYSPSNGFGVCIEFRIFLIRAGVCLLTTAHSFNESAIRAYIGLLNDITCELFDLLSHYSHLVNTLEVQSCDPLSTQNLLLSIFKCIHNSFQFIRSNHSEVLDIILKSEYLATFVFTPSSSFFSYLTFCYCTYLKERWANENYELIWQITMILAPILKNNLMNLDQDSFAQNWNVIIQLIRLNLLEFKPSCSPSNSFKNCENLKIGVRDLILRCYYFKLCWPDWNMSEVISILMEYFVTLLDEKGVYSLNYIPIATLINLGSTLDMAYSNQNLINPNLKYDSKFHSSTPINESTIGLYSGFDYFLALLHIHANEQKVNQKFNFQINRFLTILKSYYLNSICEEVLLNEPIVTRNFMQVLAILAYHANFRQKYNLVMTLGDQIMDLTFSLGVKRIMIAGLFYLVDIMRIVPTFSSTSEYYEGHDQLVLMLRKFFQKILTQRNYSETVCIASLFDEEKGRNELIALYLSRLKRYFQAVIKNYDQKPVSVNGNDGYGIGGGGGGAYREKNDDMVIYYTLTPKSSLFIDDSIKSLILGKYSTSSSIKKSLFSMIKSVVSASFYYIKFPSQNSEMRFALDSSQLSSVPQSISEKLHSIIIGEWNQVMNFSNSTENILVMAEIMGRVALLLVKYAISWDFFYTEIANQSKWSTKKQSSLRSVPLCLMNGLFASLTEYRMPFPVQYQVNVLAAWANSMAEVWNTGQGLLIKKVKYFLCLVDEKAPSTKDECRSTEKYPLLSALVSGVNTNRLEQFCASNHLATDLSLDIFKTFIFNLKRLLDTRAIDIDQMVLLPQIFREFVTTVNQVQNEFSNSVSVNSVRSNTAEIYSKYLYKIIDVICSTIPSVIYDANNRSNSILNKLSEDLFLTPIRNWVSSCCSTTLPDFIVGLPSLFRVLKNFDCQFDNYLQRLSFTIIVTCISAVREGSTFEMKMLQELSKGIFALAEDGVLKELEVSYERFCVTVLFPDLMEFVFSANRPVNNVCAILYIVLRIFRFGVELIRTHVKRVYFNFLAVIASIVEALIYCIIHGNISLSTEIYSFIYDSLNVVVHSSMHWNANPSMFDISIDAVLSSIQFFFECCVSPLSTKRSTPKPVLKLIEYRKQCTKQIHVQYIKDPTLLINITTFGSNDIREKIELFKVIGELCPLIRQFRDLSALSLTIDGALQHYARNQQISKILKKIQSEMSVGPK